MSQRKPISRKIRFEIFKRDGFKCIYCGKTPEHATLEIDHIKPVSGGGTNKKDNLATACFDCNRGKQATPLDDIPHGKPPEFKIDPEELIAREQQLKEYRKLIRRIENRKKKDIDDIAKIYDDEFKYNDVISWGWHISEGGRLSIKEHLDYLPKHYCVEIMRESIIKYPNADKIKKAKKQSTEANDHYFTVCNESVTFSMVEEIFKKAYRPIDSGNGFTQQISIKKFLGKLSRDDIVSAMQIASVKVKDPDGCISYFCGICWRKIKGGRY